MSLIRTVTFAAAAALIAGSAYAQAAADVAVEGEVAADAAVEVPAAPPTPAALAYRPITATGSGNLQATLEAAGQFSKFLAAAEKTGLHAFLTGENQLTLLVPTDAAFDAYGSAQLDALMEANPATDLQRLLLKHVINARIMPEQVDGAKGPVPTVAQVNVEIDGSVMPMKIDQAVVLQGDVAATNGVIYVIDRVL